MKKLIGIFLLGMILAVSTTSAYESIDSRTLSANGNLPATQKFTVKVMGGKKVNFTTLVDQKVVTSPQYLEIEFSNNLPGYQAIIIGTDNRSPNANPHYNGNGSGAGLIGLDDSRVDVPLHWVVFDSPTNYKFVPGNGEPIDTRFQYFVQDAQQHLASFPVEPYNVGYGSMIFSLASSANFKGNLAKAPTGDGQGGYRITKDGVVYIYLAANYTGKKKQKYRTSTLTVAIVTVPSGQPPVVIAEKNVPVSVSTLR
jgi:hypothetical protein